MKEIFFPGSFLKSMGIFFIFFIIDIHFFLSILVVIINIREKSRIVIGVKSLAIVNDTI